MAKTHRVHDGRRHVRDTHTSYTTRQWDAYFYALAPQHIRHTPAAHAWAEERHDELPTILASIPDAVQAALDDSNVDGYKYFSLVDNQGVHKQWVERTVDENTGTQLHEIILDISGFPHRTGKPGSLRALHPIPALVWEEQPSDSDDDDGDTRPHRREQTRERRSQIVGPITTAQPHPAGWRLKGASSKAYITKATSIKRVTQHHTKQIVGSTRPNCEHNWSHAQPGVRSHVVSYPLHWPKIWGSVGTPLSDATEERIWRRMLHRALDVRNRHKELPRPHL